MNPDATHFSPCFLRGKLLPGLACLLALWARLLCLHAEDTNEATRWRPLPLITNGHLDESWLHIGWGGFTVDGDSLRTECDPKGLGLLVYGKERFGNCQLRVVYESKEAKSNSGVFVRIADGILDQVNKPGAVFDRDAAGKISAKSMQEMMASAEREEGPWFAVHRGYEIQILDANDQLHRTGAIYSLAASSAIANKPPGEWKTMIITLSGNRIRVDVDDERVTSFDPESPDVSSDRKWFEPKREPKRPEFGYIGLQNHDPGDVVWFREVSVRPRPADESAEPRTGKKTVLGIQDTHFVLNGRPTFLLGISYYGALGAPEEFIRRDLDEMKSNGFNWLRVWATWAAFDHDVSAVDAQGEPREPFLGKLQWLVTECEARGLVVDVTLTRNQSPSKRVNGGGLPDFSSHQRAVETLINNLKRHRNWYLDLANERDVRDARYVSPGELKSLRELARRLDAQLLVTASFGGHDLTETDFHDSLITAGLDFLSPHRPRGAESPSQTEAQTRACLAMAKAGQRRVPVHYQEPFRRGYQGWEPAATDFLTDLRGAITGGAAGWCFHNGSERGSPDNQPRRSFDMRTKRLFDQLDPEERMVVAAVKPTLNNSRSSNDPSIAEGAEIDATRVDDFLSSIGVCSAVSRRGESLTRTIEAARYLGLRWIRAGYESGIPVADLLELHQQTGIRFSYGLMSGGMNITRLLDGARQLASAGALIAIEGNNEPNNWGITYEGQRGGRTNTWLPVAKLQRDLYRAVKSDPILKEYPIWSISESGAEADNVGLQFLSIPNGAETLMPEGTAYADFANCHNYLTHPSWRGLHDNQTWIAADPTSASRVDGLFGNYGVTWRKKFQGYSAPELLTLPRVTTETGVTIDGVITEEIQACLYLTVYLDQFKRGWRHTAVYLLRDRTDERGNQTFGFYKPDYTPRLAATYLHNLTTILEDKPSDAALGRLNYSIPSQPTTVHDLLLQKGDGKFELIVWAERFTGGSDSITVNLGAAFPSMRIFDPTISTSPIQSLSNTASLNLILSNRPVVIEMPVQTR